MIHCIYSVHNKYREISIWTDISILHYYVAMQSQNENCVHRYLKLKVLILLHINIASNLFLKEDTKVLFC